MVLADRQVFNLMDDAGEVQTLAHDGRCLLLDPVEQRSRTYQSLLRAEVTAQVSGRQASDVRHALSLDIFDQLAGQGLAPLAGRRPLLPGVQHHLQGISRDRGIGINPACAEIAGAGDVSHLRHAVGTDQSFFRRPDAGRRGEAGEGDLGQGQGARLAVDLHFPVGVVRLGQVERRQRDRQAA